MEATIEATPELSEGERILAHLAGMGRPCEASNIGIVIGGLMSMRQAESWARPRMKPLIKQGKVKRVIGGAYELTPAGRRR